MAPWTNMAGRLNPVPNAASVCIYVSVSLIHFPIRKLKGRESPVILDKLLGLLLSFLFSKGLVVEVRSTPCRYGLYPALQ